ncbi:hypothetical protein [Lysobacter sp. Root983]|uniref:hypothetical protein n=1 Tax=Lysobacter sp. Root983 TaxID=1736613 RepID=UPI0012FB05BD|nr:hypothetical protein [Lysobacter sp. Root983]
MKLLRCGFVLAMLAAPIAVMAGQRPAQVAADFYRLAIHPDRPEPVQGRFATMAPLLGEDLYRALAAYDVYENACARITPRGIKPYMLDQNPFFWGADEADAMVAATERVDRDVARVWVALVDDDVRWTDAVLLGKQRGRWVILDIRWQEGGSLTERLMEFASHRCTP